MTKLFKMKTTGKIWLLACMAAAVTMLTGCSTDDSETSDSVAEYTNGANQALATGTYEGEWTVNQQLIGVAQMEMGITMKLPLPQHYLATYCFGDINGAAETVDAPSEYYLQQQGYSDNAVFMNYLPSMERTVNGLMLYNNGEFDFTLDDTLYHIIVLSTQNGSVVYNLNTQQWTVAVPVLAFRITDTETQETRQENLEQDFTLYYNTTKRIR